MLSIGTAALSRTMTRTRQFAATSLVPAIVACMYSPGLVASFAPSFPVRDHIRTLKIKSTAKDDDSSWQAPPDFSVDDDHLFEEDKARNAYLPPDFTIDEDDDDYVPPASKEKPMKPSASDEAVPFFAEQQKADVPTRRSKDTKPQSAARRNTKAFKNESMRITSWMDKNVEFQKTEAPLEPKRNEDRKPRVEREKSGRLRDRRDRTEKNQTFRQDYRGTRVFVQGIPPDIAWQELKDHFRIAGEVVFASVSIDARTGESKRCGVVQYETTEMAQKAIRCMRDYPLGGSPLYVREDVQEKDGARLGSPMSKGDKKSTIPMSWTCADQNALDALSKSDTTAVYSLIRARDDARRRRNYDASDDMREELKVKFGVHLDDRLKMWWVSPDGRQVPQSVSDVKGDGRWGASKPWRQIPTTPENDACVNPDLVNGLLAQRDVARREKDFSTADSLLEQARTAPDGDLNLRIHDESRTWRIWTDAPPPPEIMYGAQKNSDQFEEKKTPAEQCMDIVNEYAPEKVTEIENMLKKFPGREYNILKKLKQRYLNQ